MNCPVCNVELRLAERQNVEIDYCPQCRGVWLDRGELDKIIEKTGHEFSHTEHRKPHYDDHKEYDKHYDNKHHDNDHKEYNHYGKKHKKESFFADLFDF